MTAAVTREQAHTRRRDAHTAERPPRRCDLRLALGEWPWWVYSTDDYPGRSEAEIRAGLTVPVMSGDGR